MSEEFNNISEQSADNEALPRQTQQTEQTEPPIEQDNAPAQYIGVEENTAAVQSGENSEPNWQQNSQTQFTTNSQPQYNPQTQFTPFSQPQYNPQVPQMSQIPQMPPFQAAPTSDGYSQQNPYANPENNVYPQPQYGTVNYMPVQKEKKGVPAGLVIFLVTAFVVLVLCICLTVVAVSKSPSDSSSDKNVFNYNYQQPTSGYEYSTQPSTESSNALDESDLVDTTDENGPQITLESQPKDILDNSKYTAKYAYDKAQKSVVGVIGYTSKEKSKIGSQGTGIIISENGYIVTNSHVIGDSKTKYMVTVSIDGQEYDARVTGYDSRTDIAVIKIDKTGLTPADFADSGEVSVGQEVVAIGNPGGINFSNSLTQGIVSALDRDVSHGNVSYIQTDAAINPGNSGGPLLNMSGQVIGITTVKIVNTSYEGMGFAIPSQQAVSVIDSIIKRGYVEGRVRIGLTGNEINTAYASYYDMPVGIYVVTVDENGPLAGKDIQPGDIITKIDDVDITSFSVLYKELDKHKPGDVVTLTYQRMDEYSEEYNEELTLDVTLAADSSAE